MVDTFHADPGYIKAMAQNVNDYWVKNGRPDRLVMCFMAFRGRRWTAATLTTACVT